MRFFFTALLLLAPLSLFAATGDFVPLAPVPNLGTSGDITLEQYVNAAFMLTISIAAILAVLRIITGGFKYMTTEAVNAKGDARATIQNAVIGLVLLLSVWLVLTVINPQIVTLSALNFSELAPTDAFIKAVAEDRNLREEIARKLEEDAQNFANPENFERYSGSGLGDGIRNIVDSTFMLNNERQAFIKACSQTKGARTEVQVTRTCVQTSTGKEYTAARSRGTLFGGTCDGNDTEIGTGERIQCYIPD